MKLTQFAILLLVAAQCAGCVLGDGPLRSPTVITVDLLDRLGLDANALGPQVVRADSDRNRVFALCANSSAVGVIEGDSDRVFTIPIGVRMPRRLREPGTAISAATGRLFVCAHEALVIVDADRRSAVRIALPGEVPSALNPPTGCRFHTRCPLAMERCTQQAPPEVACAPDHTARCFLVDTAED